MMHGGEVRGEQLVAQVRECGFDSSNEISLPEDLQISMASIERW